MESFTCSVSGVTFMSYFVLLMSGPYSSMWNPNSSRSVLAIQLGFVTRNLGSLPSESLCKSWMKPWNPAGSQQTPWRPVRLMPLFSQHYREQWLYPRNRMSWFWFWLSSLLPLAMLTRCDCPRCPFPLLQLRKLG